MEQNNSPHISVVSPVYKAENIVEELVSRLQKELSQITPAFEIILVEDGGKDKSWEKIEALCRQYPFVKGIKLSRNFGQHHAITAGLDHVSGEWIVVMDCDLQDRPEEIVRLYNKAAEGFDIVLGQRVRRNDSFFKRKSSKFFYRTFAWLTKVPQDESVANFGIYHRKVIDAVNRMRESTRAFAIMVKWVGFKKTSIEITHGKRFEGKSTYNIPRLLNFATDIILAYSDKPLKLAVSFGLFVSAISMGVALYYLIAWMMGYITVLGYTSLIISIWFLSGLIISIIGIVGLYLGKTFEGVKNRPIYITEKKINLS
ncbi:MAG: glycosyltransferase family 2 protein [Bacteroidota bacterium]